MTSNKNVNEMLILQWAKDHEDGLMVTPQVTLICGGFRPKLNSPLLKGWVPIKAMANINDKWGYRDH